MPGLNDYWSKYGCTKCDNYKLLVLEVNASDSKQWFVSDVKNNNVKYPAVAQGDGADRLFKSVGQGADVAGPRFLIKPDKSAKAYPSASDVNNACGNKPHDCNTGVCAHERPDGVHDISVGALAGGKLSIVVPAAGRYRIFVHTVDGRLVAGVQTRLGAGGATVRLWNGSGPARIMVITVKSGKNLVVQKIVRCD